MKKNSLFEKYINKESVLKSENIEIGDGTRINGKILIHGKSGVKIGKFNAIGYGIKIISTSHNINYPNIQLNLQRKLGCVDLEEGNIIDEKFSVILHNNIWVGNNVSILSGVEVGSGSILATGSVINKSIEPFSIYMGNPARNIGYRFKEETIRQLLKIKWWDWNENKIKKNKVFFDTDLNKYKGNISDLIK